MDNFEFTGREQELSRLNDLLTKKTASLVVIKGRRRIGKSRLVDEFGRGKTFYRFSGLTPTSDVTAQDQRDAFSQQLNQQTGLPEIETDDWSKLFLLLAERIKQGRVIILFDEITWMAHKDPTFLGKLKNAWDMHFKNNPKLIFILCGSISTWIDKNIISSTGYFGRISETITLDELPIKHCNDLLKEVGFNRSPLEKFMLLSLTGGVPWYIEQVNPKYSAPDNIKRLCFAPDGLLVDEHKHIFHDLFGNRSEIYAKIVANLASGPSEYRDIAAGIHYPSSGSLSEYLEDLQVSGYIHRDNAWSFQTGEETSISTYRLSDNYLRFYFKYMKPKINKIKRGQYKNISLTTLPNWDGIFGLQFENLVLNNRDLICEKLNINPADIVADNAYYQRQTKRLLGCQIDYLIHTRFNTLFICEIKFSKNPIGCSVITQVKEKIKRLKVPKGFSCVPILIHINGVTDELLDENYFIEIIDFSEFL